MAGTLEALAGELVPLLEARGAGGRLFEASFFRADGAVRRIAVQTGRPHRNAKMLTRLFSERLDALADPVDPGFGFDMIRLAALASEAILPSQTELDGRAGDDEALGELVDRLGARFGPERVIRFVPQDSHVPERSARAVPAISPAHRQRRAGRPRPRATRRPARSACSTRRSRSTKSFRKCRTARPRASAGAA